MRKFLSFIAIAAMCGTVFTSCSDDDEPAPGPIIEPNPTTVTDGVFILNAGNAYNNIDGSLTYISTEGDVMKDAFASVNGRTLGGTPNDIIVHGGKVYIVSTDENTIEVIDKNTFQSIKQLSTTELMGTDKGKQPRHLTAGGQYVFVSTYDGYVAAIDTASYEATVYEAGSYPEGMILSGNTLYVANSDYSYVVNASISAIHLQTGDATLYTDELITNPQSFAAIGNALYFLDWGSYDASYNQTGAGIRKIENETITNVAPATLMAANPESGLIYIINAPYTYPATPVTYSVYDTKTGTTTKFIDGNDIESPAAIAVDPVTGAVFITSYRMNADTGYADYNSDGYVRVYSPDGTFVKEYETGVGPVTVAFNHNTYEVTNE